MVEKTYLGDSVYADYDDNCGYIILTTENSSTSSSSNCIFLEPQVIRALIRFIGLLHSREATTK